MTRQIEVHIEQKGTTAKVGLLHEQRARRRTSVTFQYAPEWLARDGHFSLEPALALNEGNQVPLDGREIFGAFSDSAPDRWGRQLMQRAEARQARAEGRHEKTLEEIDYLLGVSDAVRLGALRFRYAGEEEFQAPPTTEGGVPPIVDMGKLLQASDRILAGEETDEDLQLIFAPGSSLGGARPKACVAKPDGSLWIAKFPRPEDQRSIERWEAIAMCLAREAGIQVPEHELVEVAGRKIFLSRRFDRELHEGERRRVMFLSAMAMLGRKDGDTGAYPEIAEAIETHGAAPKGDLAELFRRVAFSIAIANVDDHLRNHGFLYAGARGWKLAPAYDLNPVPAVEKARNLSLAIDLTNAELDYALLKSTAEWYHLSAADADQIIDQVRRVVGNWRSVAQQHGVANAELSYMESAFAA